MEPNRRCPRCGTELTAGSLEELCPRCLLMAGLESGPVQALSPPTEAYSGSREALRPEELAPYFPQLEIIELLGKGGMGAVYKARQPGLDRLVALKILPPETGADPGFAERFRREAQALARLNHPHIVGVYDFGQTAHGPPTPPGPPFERGGRGGAGLYYFLMEYVDGVNLRQAMRAGGLKPAEALKIVPQICDALQFAHDEGIVHRDIKPENILLDRKGRVKIADFGLAKLLGAKPDRALTHTQQAMGTPHYMAPEQIQGARDVDHRADIYSLGVTFYEMLTGELPLGRFAPPSKKVHIDVRLDEVVLRSLEVEPEKRFQHASDLKTEVETIGGVMGLSPMAMRQLFGKEYKSKATIFGIPLLHIAFGVDPKTGKKRIARGVIALGDIAIGGFASGGVAVGGVAFGGVSIGLVSVAGCALGLLLAVGGLAVGGVAFGGMAVGGVAIGGGAVGYYASGGGGWGVHGLFSEVQDPEAVAFFETWAMNWPAWLACLGIGLPLLSVLLFVSVWCVFRFLAPREAAAVMGHERVQTAVAAAKAGGSTVRQAARRPLEDSAWYNLGIVIGFLTRIRFWPLVTCLAGASFVLLSWNQITIRGNIGNRGGHFISGLWADFAPAGYESWPGLVVAAAFMLSACVIVATWSLAHASKGRALLLMVAGLIVLLASAYFIARPPFVEHALTNLAVKNLVTVFPETKVAGRSDEEILRDAARTLDVVITNEPLARPYWNLILGAALMLQGALELQRCLRAQAALAAADEWTPARR